MDRKTLKTILLILASTFAISSCSFVRYEKEPEQIVESLELKSLKQQYIDNLNNKYNSADYYALEQIQVEELVIESSNRIREANSEEEIQNIYNKACESLDSIKTIQDYIDEEIKKFNDYITNCIKTIMEYVSLDDYREAEQEIILEKIDEYSEKLNKVTTIDEADELVRQYKVEVYALLTDKDYYAQELKELKEELVDQLYNIVSLSLYRENEASQIQTLMENGDYAINTSETKEDANDAYTRYRDAILEIKTDEELTILELKECAESYISLLTTRLISSGLSDSYYEDALTIIEEATTVLLGKASVEEIEESYIFYLKELFVDALNDSLAAGINSYRNACIEELNMAFDEELYTEENIELGREFINEAVAQLNNASTKNEFDTTTEQALEAINSLPTKDEESSLENFKIKLHELYGDNILKEPECGLENANSLSELADIIDYYAFYQISDDKFLCNKVVVNLNFEFPNKSETFFDFYPELFERCIEYSFKLSTNKIVITLKACPFVDTHNNHTARNTKKYVNYDAGHTSKRDSNFDNFAYKQNENLLTGIWNTQQLWYALEKGYNVECVPDSMADLTLKQAKKILIDRVNDEMNVDEKLFNIATYFGEHVWRASRFFKDHPYNDIVRRADSAMFGYPAVCQGAVKAFIILTRMEGIESTKTSCDTTNHVDCLYLSSNNKHYVTSVYYVYSGNASGDIAYSFISVPTEQQTFIKRVEKNKPMEYISSNEINPMYSYLKFHSKNVYIKTTTELDSMIDELRLHPREVAAIIIDTSNSEVLDYLESLEEVTKKETTSTSKCAPKNVREFALSL